MQTTPGPSVWTAPEDNASLALFRLLFGLAMVYRTAWYLLPGYHAYFATTGVQLPFYGFGWLPWPGAAVWLPLTVALIAAAGIAAGAFFRTSCLTYALCFGYVFFLDASTWGNLDYLSIWLALALAMTPADRRLSLRTRRDPEARQTTAPRWALWLLPFQLGLVYFFAGLIKLQRDWLSGDTFRVFMSRDLPYPELVSTLSSPAVSRGFAISGAAFDLLIAPLMLWPRTRIPALLAMLTFHLVNFLTLDLAYVPWVTASLTFVAFAPRPWLAAIMGRLEGEDAEPRPAEPEAMGGVMRGLLIAYVVFQIAMPLRPYAQGFDGLWTYHGVYYSWWLRSFHRATKAKFYVVSGDDPTRHKVDVLKYIDPQQANFASDPYNIVRFAHAVAADHRAKGAANVRVYADIQVGLNGHPHAPFVDPEVDLARVPLSFDMTHILLPRPAAP